MNTNSTHVSFGNSIIGNVFSIYFDGIYIEIINAYFDKQ